MSGRREPWWPIVEDAVKLHRAMMRRCGDDPAACDPAKLDGALKRPQWLFHYQELDDPIELGVALATAVAVSHAFSDGNKRTALTLLAVFLRRNGLHLVGQAGSVVLGRQIEEIVIGFHHSPERGQLAQQRLADTLRGWTHSGDPASQETG